ncbi:MAG: Ig-like domain-containing protein [bacterium]
MMRVWPRDLTLMAAAMLVVALGCGGDGTGGSGPTIGPPASVVISTAPPATAVVAASAGSFTVKVVDAGGKAVSGIAVTFTTSGQLTASPLSAVTDAAGLASTQLTMGTLAGPVTVTARAAGVTTGAVATVTAQAGPAAKVTATPHALRFVVVGDTARVRATVLDAYGNAAGSGAVTYSVVDGTLVSVDAAGLVRALRADGTTLLITTSGARADTTTVNVLPAGSSYCTGLVTAAPMAVGDVQTFSGSMYGCVSGASAGAEFTVVAFNGSQDQIFPLSVSVTGNGLATAPTAFRVATGGPALRSVSGSRAAAPPRLDEQFHLALLGQARAEHRDFGAARSAMRTTASRSIIGSGAGTSIRANGIPSTVAVGDLVSLNVSANFCASPVYHALRVTALGSKSIILADTLNPTGGFVASEYDRIAARFDTLVYPLDVGAFGAPSDIDGNGRVAIIFTRTVNELVDSTSGYFVGGFFNPRDLFPKTASTPANSCAGSNEGEMFYMVVPAPNGIRGVVHTTGFVDSLTTGIVAHEFQHLINGSRRFYINTAATDFEEVWLNEGLSHIAEELLYYRESGLTPRQNLDDNTIRVVNRATYGLWKSDAASNFSRLLSYLRAPADNSPYADDDELATRGAIWSFLRYAADRLGTTDGTIWQRFDDATAVGFGTLQQVYGTDPVPLVRDWTVANYMDDLGLTADPRYAHRSWNFRDIYTKTFLNIPTYPLALLRMTDGAATNLSVRGGSAAYLRLAVPAGREGLLTFSTGGGAPSASFQFMVIRTK